MRWGQLVGPTATDSYPSPSQLLLKQYEAEIKSLRQELAMHDTLSNRTSVSYEPLSEAEVQGIQGQVRQYLEGTLPEIEVGGRF